MPRPHIIRNSVVTQVISPPKSSRTYQNLVPALWNTKVMYAFGHDSILLELNEAMYTICFSMYDEQVKECIYDMVGRARKECGKVLYEILGHKLPACVCSEIGDQYGTVLMQDVYCYEGAASLGHMMISMLHMAHQGTLIFPYRGKELRAYFWFLYRKIDEWPEWTLLQPGDLPPELETSQPDQEH